MGEKKSGPLALGTRQDALTWEKGCQSVGIDPIASLREPSPDMAELRTFFSQAPNWLYLGGHFGSKKLMNDAYLNNDTGAVTITFATDHIKVVIDGKDETLRKDDKFLLHKKCEVVLWGGCSVCSTGTIQVLRKLFGKHLLLGFDGETGWKMVDAMLGNGFIKKEHFFANVKGQIGDLKAVRNAWMKAAQAGYGSVSNEDKFRAIDVDGQGWKLKDKKIVKWTKF
jgi:hypothetical protein